MYQKILNKFSKLNKNQVLVGTAVLAIAITGVLFFVKPNFGSSGILSFIKFGSGNPDAIAKKAVDFLNANILQGQTATLISASSESGVVKLKISIGGKTYDSYVTKDGKTLFPQVLDMGLNTKQQNTQASNKQASQTPSTPVNVAKADKSQLDVYVVSKCPFGLQVQRAISNAVKNIPSLTQNIKVRYIGAVSGNTITAMHGDPEAQENLRQICIREEQSNKYWGYIACHIQKGDQAGCEASTGVDSAKLGACTKDVKRGVAYAQEDFDGNAKYSVQGSPTFVLNGTVIDETSFGGRSADGMKNIICDSSSKKPDFCSKQLETGQAATSFSPTYN